MYVAYIIKNVMSSQDCHVISYLLF